MGNREICLAAIETRYVEYTVHLLRRSRDIQRPLDTCQRKRFFIYGQVRILHGKRGYKRIRERSAHEHPRLRLATRGIDFQSKAFHGLIRTPVLQKFGYPLMNVASGIRLEIIE